RKEKQMVKSRSTRPQPAASVPVTRRGAGRLRPGLPAWCAGSLLLLLLGGGSATPARAEGGTIDGPRSDTIYVYAGETLNIGGGAELSPGDGGVDVSGGAVNISGGSSSGLFDGVFVLSSGGTVNISGGSISGSHGVALFSGTVSISGGSISGSSNGVRLYGGT